MERSRDSRRIASNGLSRRRHRSTSIRDSPAEDDGPVDLPETARRKKDRDRDRERDRDRDRDRDRLNSRRKRRRGDRLLHGTNREDGGDYSSEESVNEEEEEEEEEEEDGGPGSSMRMLPPNPSSFSNNHNHLHHHRKTFPPPAKVFKASPSPPTTAMVTPWKAPDEMIGVSVPRKARSASTKRSHDFWASNGGVGAEHNLRQASASPVRSSGPCVTAVLASASASPAPVSPSSSNASVKKKMKPNGSKQRPPKSSSKSASSTQEEIEMEIAQVLYGLMNQPQGPSREDMVAGDGMKFDSSKEVSNHKLTADAKSRVSSPISNSLPQSSSIPSTNPSSCAAAPMSAIAPKRKRPRPVKDEDESPSNFPFRKSPISSTTKADLDLPPQIDNCSSIVEKNSTNPVGNGGVSYDLLVNHSASASADSQLQPDSLKENLLSDLKPVTEDSETKDMSLTKEEPVSPKKESPSRLRLEEDCENLAPSKPKTTVSEIEGQREEKFQIDLMAPPPLRSSPERDNGIDFVAVDPKAVATDVETATVKENEKAVKIGKEDMNVELDEKKAKVIATEEVESHKPIVNNKERNIDLQLDLEKSDRDSGTVTVTRSGNKPQQNIQEQHQQPNPEKNAQSSSLPLPLSMAGWPGGLPHMGYMAPLQGVVSVDGSSVPPAALQPPHLLVNQPRPKRCANHCYIARNIHCHQQFTRMNPYWPAATGSALQLGAKACNLNAVPPTETQAAKGLNTVQDKGQGLPSHSGKDKSYQAANIMETGQRKQILLQQAIPPGAPSNILHGPAFIFPLSQQQAAATNSVRASAKSPLAAGGAASSASNSASVNASSAAVATGPSMSFNYSNMPGSEPQYVAILQNGPYSIPIPPHVGPAPAYRGTHPQPMPFFNGTFYSSQILHPSQLQQQQPPPTQLQQSQQGHQNQSISSGSSSSQKHLQNQVNHQRPHGTVTNGSNGNLQGFPTTKTQTSQSLQLQQRQQGQNAPHQARLEGELGSEDSPSSADSRVPRASMNIYGHNFTIPIHPPNFAMMHPASVSTSGAANNAGGNPSEKKQLQPQPHSTKAGVELLPSQSFAMSFASINGAATAAGLDISSIAQNHALLQSLPEAARQGYHHYIAAAAVAQATQHKKRENESSSVEDERKSMAGGKTPATTGQSIAFSRPDLTDATVSAAPSNTVIDSAARNLNLGSAAARTSSDVMSVAVNSTTTSMHQQLQRNQQQPQHQQMVQLQKQHLLAPPAIASARSKAPTTSSGSVYIDHMSAPSSIAGKFPNALSGFPQSLVQGSSSPSQSPHWKTSIRSSTSQISSQSFASTSPSLKNLSQQQGRTQQGHTQISFATNSKSSATSQGQPPANSNQSPSPSMGVCSPTTSSVSKGASGSPRTTSTSTSNKAGQASSLSSQQTKTNSVPTQKSSPVGGRNIQSILCHPHNTVHSSSSGAKPQLQQQQQQQHHHQQQVAKHAMQQHMMYANAYVQVQPQAQRATNLSNTSPPASGFYLQRHHEQQQKQPPGSSGASTGILSLCPVTLSNTSTSDPAKTVVSAAAAASNIKGGAGGGLPPQGLVHAQFAAATAQSAGKVHQLLPSSFPYGHAVPAAVQVKPAEQKQPAGD